MSGTLSAVVAESALLPIDDEFWGDSTADELHDRIKTVVAASGDGAVWLSLRRAAFELLEEDTGHGL